MNAWVSAVEDRATAHALLRRASRHALRVGWQRWRSRLCVRASRRRTATVTLAAWRVAALSIRLGFRLRLRSDSHQRLRARRTAFDAWCELAERRTATVALLRRSAAAMMHLGLRAAMNAWSVCLVASRRRRRMRAVVRRFMLTFGLRRWVRHSRSLTATRELGRSVARRWRRAQLLTALVTWADHAAQVRAWKRSVARWRSSALYATFARWSLYAERRLDAAERAKAADTLRKRRAVRSWARARTPVSYTHLRAHETDSYLVCRLLLEKKKN